MASAEYHHVGTGVTTSTYWCRACEGYYGVPHDGDTHNHRPREGCACAVCQKATGRYGAEGVFMEHERYLTERAAGVVHSGSAEANR